MDNIYFANESTENFATEVISRVNDYYTYLQTSGMYERMRKSYSAYYGFSGGGGNHTSSEIQTGGVQGELSLMKVNHYRNLLQNMLVLTTSTRPTLETRATNTDHRSLAQTVLANGVLEYYMREKKLERYMRRACEYALVFSESYILQEWDSSLGEDFDVDTETGRIIHTGDIRYNVLSPLDVVKDVYLESWDDKDWVIVRHFRNKFDLAAKYPELESDILSLGEDENVNSNLNFFTRATMSSNNLIPVFEFFHNKTEAVPEGRYSVVLSSDVTLYDGPLPYNAIPVFRMAPNEFIGSTHGYTTGFDLLAIQDAIDALYSTVLTNQTTFGVQNILAPHGHNISVTEISGGLNLIEYDPNVGPPTALNLTQTPPEIFKFIEMLRQEMETISGINNVTRGAPQPSLRSGTSLALVQAMAIQFASGLQQAYAQLLEDVGTSTIKTLQDFADIPRIAMIAGKSERVFVKEFKGSDLDKISRVVVDLANPLSSTIAGKVEIASELLQQGLIKNPEQYFQVLKTGSLDSMYEGQYNELMYIREENENLSQGKPASAIITDNHLEHITEHKAVLNSLDARQDPQILQAALDHINEHLGFLREGDPQLLAMLGQQPLEDPNAPPPLAMEGEAPAGAAEGVLDSSNPFNLEEAQMPGMPDLPEPAQGTITEDAYQQTLNNVDPAQ